MQNFTPAYMKGADLRATVLRMDDFLRTKISWIHRLPNSLTHGAPLRAPHSRKSSAINTVAQSLQYKSKCLVIGFTLLN